MHKYKVNIWWVFFFKSWKVSWWVSKYPVHNIYFTMKKLSVNTKSIDKSTHIQQHCMPNPHLMLWASFEFWHIYIYQMDRVCQCYHKECSTCTCADDCYNCWKKSKLKSYDLSLDFFQQLYIYIWYYNNSFMFDVITESCLNFTGSLVK